MVPFSVRCSITMSTNSICWGGRGTVGQEFAEGFRDGVTIQAHKGADEAPKPCAAIGSGEGSHP